MRTLSRYLPKSTGAILRSTIGLGLLALAITLGVGSGGNASAATSFTVGAGVGSGTIAGNVYAPGDITVNVGDTVTWTVQSDEPHTVTFGQVPTGEDPTEFSTFTGAPPNLGTNTYDGTGVVSTGLAFNGFSAGVNFTAPGDYGFGCEIHPGMNGTVHVKPAGETAETQAQLDAKATQTKNAILAQVDPLTAATVADVTSDTRSDGTKLWHIFTNAITDPAGQPGGGTGYLELLRFMPPTLQIGAGDTVEWKATSVHTVTFVAAGQTPDDLIGAAGGSPFAVPPSKPSENYDPAQTYNSGALLAGPPGTPDSFTLTFPTAGTYNYLCLIHGPFGQTGAITVAAKTAASPTPGSLPNTGGPLEDGGGGSASWVLWIALGIAALAVAGGAGLASRRLRK
ncbi:MAG: plastocyanin/azurin family copper-binding protein [Chloroflexota bacterium]